MQNSSFLSFIFGIGLLVLFSWYSIYGQELNSHPEDRLITPKIHPALITKQVKSNENIDFNAFSRLAVEVQPYRQERLICIEDFAQKLQEEGVLLLDTRSKLAYDNIHIKGAVHLNFSDFTADKLAEVIPSKHTPILIYCNNNFEDGGQYLVGKMAPLALNIPTFINLYGYGYKNIYELESTLSLKQLEEYLEIERKPQNSTLPSLSTLKANDNVKSD